MCTKCVWHLPSKPIAAKGKEHLLSSKEHPSCITNDSKASGYKLAPEEASASAEQLGDVERRKCSHDCSHWICIYKSFRKQWLFTCSNRIFSVNCACFQLTKWSGSYEQTGNFAKFFKKASFKYHCHLILQIEKKVELFSKIGFFLI